MNCTSSHLFSVRGAPEPRALSIWHAAMLLLAVCVSGCAKQAEKTEKTEISAATPAPAAPAPGGALTVGFVYVGPRVDYGYNQAHAQGAKALSSVEGVKLREEENVPETVAVQKTMESMINLDGAKVLFPTSFGYFDPHILTLAQKYPDVTFLHCGGLYSEGKHPKNVGSYFGYIDEAQYVAGVVAGGTTKTKSSASSPPSRFRRCCVTSTRTRSARAR
jgi:basic membrane lipoprotein Med (substrate-binding protein (PBP1-ABC) superfamily)